MTVAIIVVNEFAYLVEHVFDVIGLADFPFPFKMISFCCAIAIPCVIIFVLLCIAGDDEEVTIPVKKRE